MLAQLKLDESVKLEFDVSITGTTDNPKYKFGIDSGSDGMSICFDCNIVGNQIVVNLPALKGFISAGEKHVWLDVIVDGKHFTPLSDVIEFEPTIEVSSAMKPVIKPVDMVKVGAVAVKKVTETKGEYTVLKRPV